MPLKSLIIAKVCMYGVSMMSVLDLPTPCVLVDLDKLEKNIRNAMDQARRHGKKLWPMVKTFKSTYIAKILRDHGADGFLCGTIDEAEVLVEHGLGKTLMLAYPVADEANLKRVVKLVESGTRLILRIDNRENAEFLNEQLRRYGISLDYVVKVDVGLHRLGVKPERVVDFVKSLEKFQNLNFVGIATHPGNAYGARNPREVEEIAKDVAKKMETAVRSLESAGYKLEIVGTGSTPTLRFDVEEPVYTHLFPGNFVYYDRMQALVYGSAALDDCALTVLATVISKPEHAEGKLAIVNVGSKYLGLDKGAHGIEVVKGYGHIVEHPKAVIVGLSEEVGEVDISEEPSVKVGEKINIIPNHSCVANNATSYLVGHRKGRVERLIRVDMRNGSRLAEVLANTVF